MKTGLSNRIVSTAAVAILSIGISSCKLNEVQDALNTFGGGGVLSEDTIASGLKQALEVGTRKAVSQSSSSGGFSNNPLIKIAVPEKLDKVASTLRKVGLGDKVDNFELLMNRAAEQAAGEATNIFMSAISDMSVSDAVGILKGGDNAATDYFRGKTETALRGRFEPIVTNQMQKVGFYSDYKSLLGTYDAIPFTDKPNLNIEDYVTNEALDGLFTLVAQEEAAIRNDPVKRTTELLQKVFAQQ